VLSHGIDGLEYRAHSSRCTAGLHCSKEKFAELGRISILLNKTREEVARDHITRGEFRADMQQLLDRFDRIERKIDAIRAYDAAGK
jgi:hypothetical protein